MAKVISLSEGTKEFESIRKEWQGKADEATIETLPEFLKELTENYRHDYGTICHAVAIAAKASARAVDASPAGGITGFQAGCIMWQFIREWNFSGNKTGMKLVDYDNFLYPQYKDKFEKTLGNDVWESLQKEAAARIKDADEKRIEYLGKIRQYGKDISSFVEKHPDYHERRDYYDPLGMGTADQWDAETKKKESGFEFAPQPPCEPINSDSRVYLHWESIVNGVVPFGYVVL